MWHTLLVIEIRLVSPVNEVLRPDDAAVVEAGEALVQITGLADGVPIRADGVAVSPIELGGGRVLLHFDLRRSTGFHYIDVPPHRRVWFGSADDALNLEGVRQLVDDLGENALYWHGQLLFSDGTVGRSARADYGWLDGWADATPRCRRGDLRAATVVTANRLPRGPSRLPGDWTCVERAPC